MRVLVIAQYFPPDMGGGATRAHNAVKGLVQAGCDVTVVAAFPHYPKGDVPAEYRRKLLSTEYEGGVKTVRTYVPSLASEGFARRLLLFMAFVCSSLFALPVVGKVDVVWAANPNIIAMFPSLLYKFVNRCVLVQNVDDLWPEVLYDLGMSSTSFLARAGKLAARITYKLASAVTPISPAYVKVIVNKYGVDPHKVYVVGAGVEVAKFYLKETHDESKKEEFKALYIGAFSQAYDFDQVFRAANLLRDYSDVKFVIQGSGELANSLLLKVGWTKPRNVEVIDKIVSRGEVAKTLHEADVLLLPLNGIGSIEMGISSKLYEYQAAGKPIVCCSSGQPARYVSETKSGIVVAPGDHKALANAVIELKEHPTVAQAMGENGRKYVGSEAAIEVVGSKMKKIFEALNGK